MAEGKEESYITCPGCERRVPATLYCIYCGAKLPAKPTPPKTPPTPEKVAAPRPPEVVVKPPPKPVEVKEDIRKLMNNISLQYTRKIALLDLLRSKEVSEKVFLRLYDEYTDKLQNSLSDRTSILERLRSELDQKQGRYDEIKTLLEELEVRHKIGELTLENFNEKSGGLESEVEGLEGSLKNLRGDFAYLEKLFADKAPREILDLETKTKSCYDDLERLAEEKSVQKGLFEKIKPDMQSLLELLNSLIADRKKRQKELQEELETLETRYRVGEISIERYETRKRELQGELEKVWL